MPQSTPFLSRRHALFAGAAVPLAAAAASLPHAARAGAAMTGPAFPRYHRTRLGGFEVTTLLAGSRPLDEPQSTFGMNVSPEEFAEVSEANFIPSDRSLNFFTPTLVNTGAELVLFDTGLDADGILSAIEAAGHRAAEVDVVVLTHMHGDHIGGLMQAGSPTFENARYVTGAVEHNHWASAGNEGFENNVRPLEEQMTFLSGGEDVVSGITAIETFGHSPGHMAYMLESEGEQLVLIADTANHYVWSLAHPDWEVRFDMDKAAAAATRREILGMIAADRIPFVGYHMPFPARGFVEARDDGFRYVPATYQGMFGEG
ncbi:MBL fold metallo-hydrolase [Halodurantibacterium flavum]|uniref:MBL fold metallo-hydrolase n=1 Tax=Halodurantibacterium flavum TaxID=1382802 RepID=A0ABW4S2R2_9RHOB